jgi:hypothetical protein
MGFFSSISKILGPVGGAVVGNIIAPGIGGALAGAAIGSSLSGSGGSKPDELKFQPIPQSAAADEARGALRTIAGREDPVAPTRQIAGTPDLTRGQQLASASAIDLLKPQENIDISQTPEFQAVLKEAIDAGNLLTNRVGRSIQIGGAATSSTGRDVLGRTVSDVQSGITSALAPFAESQRNRAVAERSRIQNLIPQIENIDVARGGRTQETAQAGLDAKFNQELRQRQELDARIELLKSIISTQPGFAPTKVSGDPGFIEQAGSIASLIGAFSKLSA